MQAVHAIVPIASGTAPAIGPAPIALVEGAGFADVLAEGEIVRGVTQPMLPSDPDEEAIAEAPANGVPVFWSCSPMPEIAAPASVGGDHLLDEIGGPPIKVLDSAPFAGVEPIEPGEPMVPAVPAAPNTAEAREPLARIAEVSAPDRPANPGGQAAALVRVESPATEPPDRPAPSPPSARDLASPPPPRPSPVDADLRQSAGLMPDEVPASARTQMVLPDAPGGMAVYPLMRADAPPSVVATVLAPGMPPVPAAKAGPALRAAALAPDRAHAVLPDASLGTAGQLPPQADAPSSVVAAFPPPPCTEIPLRADLPQTEGPELPPFVLVPAAVTAPAALPPPGALPDIPHPPASVPRTEAMPVGHVSLPEVRDPAPLTDAPSQPRIDTPPDPAARGVLAAVPAWLRVVPAWLEIAGLEQREADGMVALGPAPASVVAAPGAPTLPSAPPPIATQVLQGLSLHQDGTTEITLSPEELGTVRLRLRPDSRDHERMVVMLSFDRPETLDLFRRHGEQLAEAIRSAGYAGVDIGFDQGGEARPDFSDTRNSGDNAPHDPDPPPPAPRSPTGAALDLRL